MPSASPSATLSTSTSANLSSPHKKFSTITGLNPGPASSNRSGNSNGTSTRTSVKGLFGEDPDSVAANSAGNGSGFTLSHGGSISRGSADGPWSISVAEVQQSSPTNINNLSNPSSNKRTSRRGSSKSGSKDQSSSSSGTAYTLYCTTPTHNLTLSRSANEIIELDQKLREGQSSANVLPKLPKLITSIPATTSPSTGGRRLFQTISRTLSPGANKNRAALSNLTASGLGLATPLDSSSVANSSESPTGGASTPTGKVASLPPSEILPSTTSAHTTTTHLATYLTSVSNIPFIKKHKAWRRFTHVRSEDLQSIRVERRVRKVRSDLAQHVKSSVAPTNTNVGPSHSDLEEDGDVEETENEIENVSTSGRSTSQSVASSSQAAGVKRSSTMRSDTSSTNHSNQRPDVPLRSTSAADGQASQDRSVNGSPNVTSNGSSARNSRSKVNGIPEDQEKEKESIQTSIGQDTEMKDVSQNGASNDPEATDSKSKKEKMKESSGRRERSERKKRDKESEKVTVDDFEMIRVLGKGCAGKVSLLIGRL